MTPDCPLDGTQSLEASLLHMTRHEWRKTGMGWEQLLFAPGSPAAARADDRNQTLITAYIHTAAEAASPQHSH